jgi:prepilin-type N-terminal cleavage/methylation domain-containing protein
MKPHCSRIKNHGLTLLEVVVVIFLLALIAMMELSPSHTKGRLSRRIDCVNNLKEIGLGFRIWEGDNNNQYPLAVSCTNGGAMEQAVSGDRHRGFSGHVE